MKSPSITRLMIICVSVPELPGEEKWMCASTPWMLCLVFSWTRLFFCVEVICNNETVEDGLSVELGFCLA